jgi:hypothetical protein
MKRLLILFYMIVIDYDVNISKPQETQQGSRHRRHTEGIYIYAYGMVESRAFPAVAISPYGFQL